MTFKYPSSGSLQTFQGVHRSFSIFVRFSGKIEMLWLVISLFWVIVTSEEEDEWFFWFDEELDGEDEDEEEV